MLSAKWRPSGLMAAVVLLIGVIVASAPLAAEPSSPLAGARARATVKETRASGRVHHQQIKGTLASVADTAIALESSDGELLALSLASVTRLDRSVKPSAKRKGALIGLGVGAGLGAIIVVAAASDDNDSGSFGEELVDETGDILSYGFAVTICLLGPLLGYIVAPGEQWERVPPDQYQPRQPVRVGFAPAPDGGGRFCVSVRF